MKSKYRDAVQSVQAWLDSINWSEETGKPFKHKDSEEVLYHHAETILSALTIADEMRWRDIKDAPRDGQWILAWHPTGMVKQTKWLADNRGWMMMSEETASQLTHWQPLPAPPTKDLAAAEGEKV